MIDAIDGPIEVHHPSTDGREALNGVNHPITAQFGATVSSIPEARRLVTSTLDSWGVDDELRADLVLTISELVTNAALYGSGPFIDVGIAEVDGTIELQVVNAVPAQSVLVPTWAMPGPTSRDGRGLALVRLLTDRVDTSTHDGCFDVRVSRRWR